jgi:hypothetical protein
LQKACRKAVDNCPVEAVEIEEKGPTDSADAAPFQANLRSCGKMI